jgi:hypothetical protein
MNRQCRQCGAVVKPVAGPGSIQDVRCSGCGAGGAILRDGRLTGPAFVRDIRGGLVIGGETA